MSGDEGFLSRWSRRKREAEEGHEARDTRRDGASRHRGTRADRSAWRPQPAPEPLPPVESLTPESDFSPFMREGVDPEVRRGAVKKLFADPRFNVMDGLDVYIDDYSKPDPLPEGWLEKMTQVRAAGHLQAAAGAGARNGRGKHRRTGPTRRSRKPNRRPFRRPLHLLLPAPSIDAPPVGESPFPGGVKRKSYGVHFITNSNNYEPWQCPEERRRAFLAVA